MCFLSGLLNAKVVFISLVLILYLQVFHRKRLLEFELKSLSVSFKQSHSLSLPFPLADKWKFPLKRQWLTVGGVGDGDERDLKPCSILEPF